MAVLSVLKLILYSGITDRFRLKVLPSQMGTPLTTIQVLPNILNNFLLGMRALSPAGITLQFNQLLYDFASPKVKR